MSSQGGDEDLLDDNGEGLLDQADIEMASTAPPRDDCEVAKDGSRKACKNCTCGRAEEEKAAPASQDGLVAAPVAASSCGNVSRGIPALAVQASAVSSCGPHRTVFMLMI
jgi:hypothetical protein